MCYLMKIVSYNVNGIRAAIKKGFVEWLREGDYDIVCIQETKAHPQQIPTDTFEALGYHATWHSAEKKGYSGLLTLSKHAPDHIVTGCGLDRFDCEGRVLRTDYGLLTIVNTYFPSGTTGDARQAVKIDFLEAIYDYTQQLLQERDQVIVLGDYNIAHTEIDLHAPKRNQKTTGFLPEERAWMTRWFGSGLHDAFRIVAPDEVAYSWWSYRGGARINNKGWRLDYHSISTPLVDRIRTVTHHKDVLHSDHCAVVGEYDMCAD